MKKSIGLIILFFIIGLVLGAIGGYLYPTLLRDKCDVTIPEISEESLDITDERIDTAMNKLNPLSCGTTRFSYLIKEDKVNKNDISNEIAINLVDKSNSFNLIIISLLF